MSGGINFNKPVTAKQLERYQKRMAAIMKKYQIIYKKFGGEADKAPNILDYATRAPMIALLKKQILKLNDVLFHAEDYIIQRNMYGNYGVRISADLMTYQDGIDEGIKQLTDSDEWQRISAL